MNSLWSFISSPKNRQIVSWIGGAVIACATGFWAVATYVYPAHESGGIVCAQGGSIAGGRDASGNSITIIGGGPAGAGSGSASCADATKK